MIKKLTFLSIFVFYLNCSEMNEIDKSTRNHCIIDILDDYSQKYALSQYGLMHSKNFNRPIRFLSISKDSKYLCVIHGDNYYNMLTILDMHSYEPAYISREFRYTIPLKQDFEILNNWVIRPEPRIECTFLNNWIIKTDYKQITIKEVSEDFPSIILSGHSDAITCIACTRGGAIIVSGSQDGTVNFWGIKQEIV